MSIYIRATQNFDNPNKYAVHKLRESLKEAKNGQKKEYFIFSG